RDAAAAARTACGRAPAAHRHLTQVDARRRARARRGRASVGYGGDDGARGGGWRGHRARARGSSDGGRGANGGRGDAWLAALAMTAHGERRVWLALGGNLGDRVRNLRA